MRAERAGRPGRRRDPTARGAAACARSAPPCSTTCSPRRSTRPTRRRRPPGPRRAARAGRGRRRGGRRAGRAHHGGRRAARRGHLQPGRRDRAGARADPGGADRGHPAGVGDQRRAHRPTEELRARSTIPGRAADRHRAGQVALGQLARAEPGAGAVPVTGPGLLVTLANAEQDADADPVGGSAPGIRRAASGTATCNWSSTRCGPRAPRRSASTGSGWDRRRPSGSPGRPCSSTSGRSPTPTRSGRWATRSRCRRASSSSRRSGARPDLRDVRPPIRLRQAGRADPARRRAPPSSGPPTRCGRAGRDPVPTPTPRRLTP